ncbi:hypothetical protein TSUD_82220 [Trifolium subterraneum]|uniref:Uncharacterized protein n=1 Tax=Trifolium subterraneum TaxID=3900 RepID=A0A2Z6NLI2_TRISU|nr:hypothetical protein TSUD_82220 [Trifolium subterraneum]
MPPNDFKRGYCVHRVYEKVCLYVSLNVTNPSNYETVDFDIIEDALVSGDGNSMSDIASSDSKQVVSHVNPESSSKEILDESSDTVMQKFRQFKQFDTVDSIPDHFYEKKSASTSEAQLFEDFVAGHFRLKARDILTACRTYTEGGAVGSVLHNAAQSSHSAPAAKKNQKEFQSAVSSIMNTLIAFFTKNGSTNCEDFRSQEIYTLSSVATVNLETFKIESSGTTLTQV